MKKALALILALAMLLSLSVTVLADDDGVITDVNSTEAQAWASCTDNLVAGRGKLPEGYKNLAAGSFFIAKFTANDFQTAATNATKGQQFKVKFSTTSETNITGFVGQYASGTWTSPQTLKNVKNQWTGINPGISPVNTVSVSSNTAVEVEAGNGFLPQNFTSNAYLAVGFALTSAIASDTPVTITLLDNAGGKIASRNYTFGASSGAPVSAIDVTGYRDSFLNQYEGTLLTDTTYGVPLKVAVTGGNGTETVTWSSSNESVATVETAASARARGIVLTESEAAYVTFKGVGTAIITASIGDVKGTYEVILSKEPSVAVAGEQNYDSLAKAVGGVADGTEIAVGKSTNIGSTVVEAGSTVTAVTDNTAAATNEGTTVTPKTLTIFKNNETQTAKVYVVSSGSDENAEKAVVTNVAKDNTFTNETSSTSVENYVNVAQVLANAVAANDGIDVSSISSMTLRLKKTSEDTSKVVDGTQNADKAALQTAISNGKAFEVHPEAVVTTKTTEGSSTTTDTVTYDASKDLAEGASFTFKLHVSSDSTDVGKTANLTHYHEEGGTWTATPIPNLIVDSNGDVTVTLNQFSYITVDSLNATDFATIVENAEAGSTITLDADVALTNTVVIDKNLTINLNGHSITATDARALWVKSGDVAITGTGAVSTVVTEGTSLDSSSSVIRVGDIAANMNKAKLTIDTNVTVSSPYCYGITAFGKNNTDGDLTTADIELVVNGTVSVSGVQAAVSGNGTNTLSATAMTINGTVTAANEYAIYHPGKGELTVNGTVSGLGGIEIKSGTLTVGENASITATATTQSHSTNNNGTSTSGYAIAAVGNSAYVGDPAVTINGGTISGTAITLAENNSVKYGTITATSNNISIPDGYEWVTEGGVSTLKKSFVSTLSDKTWDEVAWIHSANLTLLDTIQLNAYLFVPQALSSKASYVTVTFNGTESAPIYLNTLTKDNGYYPIHQKVYAAQMDYRITITLYDTDGEKMDLYQAKWGNDTWQMWELESQVFTTSVNIYLDKLAAEMTAEVNNSLNSEAQKAWAQAWYDFAVATKEYGAKAVIASSKGLKKPTT